jgi:general secretion pathway protein B
MSFILDALKKSENDRQRQTAPGMFEVKVAPPKARFPIWAVGLGLLLGVNLLVLVGLLMREGQAERAATAPVADAASAAPPAAAPVTATQQTTPVLVGVPGQTQQVATVTVTVPTGVAPNIMVAPGATAPSSFPPDTAGVVAPSSAPPLVEEPVLSSQEEPIAPDYNPADYAPAVAPSAASQTARSSGGNLPSRDDVVTGGGPAIPAMRLDLHVYAANPAERFVFINMRKLREGESLPDGTRIETITPTGAIVSYRGTRFTLQSE